MENLPAIMMMLALVGVIYLLIYTHINVEDSDSRLQKIEVTIENLSNETPRRALDRAEAIQAAMDAAYNDENSIG